MRGLVIAVLLLTSTACGSDEPAGAAATTSASAGVEVNIALQSFEPTTLTVKAGTVVTWRNSAAITRTVTSGTYQTDPATGLRTSESPDGKFDLNVAKVGDVVSYRFEAPGTYPYYCSIHKGMNATVVVTP